MRINMWGDNVIYHGELNPLFIEARDVVVVTRIDPATGEPNGSCPHITDTLAYIPNSQLEFARPLMEAAFEEGRYDDLYELFQTSYSFIPINGEAWLKLKAEGKN